MTNLQTAFQWGAGNSVWQKENELYNFTHIYVMVFIPPGKVKHWEKGCVILYWAGIADVSGCRLGAGRGGHWCPAPVLDVWNPQYCGNGLLSITAFSKTFTSSGSGVLLAFVLLILCFLTTCCCCHGKLWMQVQAVGLQCFTAFLFTLLQPDREHVLLFPHSCRQN